VTRATVRHVSVKKAAKAAEADQDEAAFKNRLEKIAKPARPN
jgi:hypothetical protein